MTEPAIIVEGLSKKYRIGVQREKYDTLRDVLSRKIGSALRGSTRGAPSSAEEATLWALKDVTLEIKTGSVVGIIGRNGAGKSTFLKILSRITEPTEGEVKIRGRIGSLLEVGTGFHQELTGRENLYLSGAILGMKHEEIDRKFDEIVSFAGVDRFIDTPVKHYSSGMHLRLAFSVAAHLEPEILLVDEVLAVGDHEFQKKCLGKMDKVASHGRTVLLVSHNLGAVKELCQTTVVLNNGRVKFHGPVLEGLSRYSQTVSEVPTKSLTKGAGWLGMNINGQANGMATQKSGGGSLLIESLLDVARDVAYGHLFLIMNDSLGHTVLHQRVKLSDVVNRELSAGRYLVRVEIPPLWLAPGMYTLSFKFIGHDSLGHEQRHISERAMLDVAGSVNGIGKAYLDPPSDWTLTPDLKRSFETMLPTSVSTKRVVEGI
ncbi:MAG: polysaccharide ABC transporter ATP-binding protein [Pyrinomonadaceae bacterium]|nr:polysaccharide ABC transporter ATP-binding protein [Pyrinomonadaceae bacterium]